MGMDKLKVWSAIVWVAATLAAYYWSSTAYYGEKIGVFARFLFRIQ